MEIIVNGEKKTCESVSVTEYLKSLAIKPEQIALELNHEILPKEQYASTMLHEGDNVEIVNFVGGG